MWFVSSLETLNESKKTFKLHPWMGTLNKSKTAAEKLHTLGLVQGAARRESHPKLSRTPGRTPERQQNARAPAERQNASRTPGRTPERQQNASPQNARAERQAERQAAQNARPRTPGSPERQTQNARGPERQTQNASPPQNARAERQGAERQIENARTPKPEQNASRTPSRDCALANLV